MALNTPGHYVLYQESGSGWQPWPAIIFADDSAPEAIQKQRPNGYVTLVLLIKNPYEFRWATTRQLSRFERPQGTELSTLELDLQESHRSAGFLVEAGVGLPYFQTEVQQQFAPVPEPVPNSDSKNKEGGYDDELETALRISLEDYGPASSNRFISSSSCALVSNSRSSYKKGDSLVESQSRIQTGNTCRGRGSALDCLRGLGQRSKTPTCDEIEGELDKSKEFVHLAVGPSSDLHLIPQRDVWHRHYFRDPRRGVNYFELNDENIWVLRHPELVNIDPEDFVFVYEYLTGNDFGHRFPVGDQVAEALAQCMSAWRSAELLDMDDLLDFITEKLETQIAPWSMWEVMAFACQVYDSTSVPLPAHDKLKALLAVYIAENYWEYVTDSDVNDQFLDRLRRLPELERDVQARRFPTINPQAETLEDTEDEG